MPTDLSIETREVSSSLTMIVVTADRTPVVVVVSPPDVLPPAISPIPGTRQRYEIACQHPAWGTITWDISWTLDGKAHGATAEAKPTGPLTIKSKPEGSKLTLGSQSYDVVVQPQ